MKRFLIFFAAVMTLLLIFRQPLLAAAETSVIWIGEQGNWAPLIFIGFYIAATLLFFPGFFLMFSAGFLFGTAAGAFCASAASLTAATLVFLLGRYHCHAGLLEKLEASPKFHAISDAVRNAGWKLVAATRLSPLFPFNFLNYAYGMSRISFSSYFFTTWLAMLPGLFLNAYIGSTAGRLLGLREMQTQTVWDWVMLAVGVSASFISTFYLVKITRAGLSEKQMPAGQTA